MTLPLTSNAALKVNDSNVEVTALGTFIFGGAVLVMELVTYVYINYAYGTVIARMGVIGGFRGIGEVLQVQHISLRCVGNVRWPVFEVDVPLGMSTAENCER